MLSSCRLCCYPAQGAALPLLLARFRHPDGGARVHVKAQTLSSAALGNIVRSKHATALFAPLGAAVAQHRGDRRRGRSTHAGAGLGPFEEPLTVPCCGLASADWARAPGRPGQQRVT